MPAFALTYYDIAGLIAWLAIGLAVVWCWCIGLTAWVLTHPPRRTYASALARGRPGDPNELPPPLAAPHLHDSPQPRTFTQWVYTTSDNGRVRMPVWDIRGQLANGPTILMLHGWGDSRLGALPRLHIAESFASRIVVPDLRGHGEATGHTTLGTRESHDLAGLLDAAELSGELIIWGWSMGAGIAFTTANLVHPRVKVTRIIAESIYRFAATPAANVMLRSGMPVRGGVLSSALFLVCRIFGAKKLTSPEFDRREHAKSARTHGIELTFLHGEHDDISPLTDALAIAESSELTILQGAGHHGIWSDVNTAPIAARAVTSALNTI